MIFKASSGFFLSMLWLSPLRAEGLLFDALIADGGEKVPQAIELLPRAEHWRLKPTAQVYNSNLYLADIVSCVALSSACLESLGLVIGRAPEPGAQFSYAKTDLKNLLERHWGSLPGEIAGPESTEVFAPYQELTPGDLQRHIETQLRHLNSEPEWQFMVQNLPQSTLRLRPGHFEISFPQLERLMTQNLRPQILIKERQLEIKLNFENGTEWHSMLRPFALSALCAEYRLNKHLDAGHVLVEEDFDRSFEPPASPVSSGSQIQELEAILGKSLKRAHSKGTKLGSIHAEKPRLVQRDEELELHLVHGQTRLNQRARALKDGGLDDSVQVETLPAKKILRARITGPGRAEALF